MGLGGGAAPGLLLMPRELEGGTYHKWDELDVLYGATDERKVVGGLGV